jgi:acyl-CoA synthetase (AMP-forming)/AMP-acid ligase II
MQLAGWMREQGVRTGTAVAIGGPNSTEWVVAFIATHLIGAVPVLLNSTLHTASQLACLGIARPALVLVDSRLASNLGTHKVELERMGVGRVYCWSGYGRLSPASRVGVIPLEPLPALRTAHEVESGTCLAGLTSESPGLILFTSGTTSTPKAVVVTQRAALSHMVSTKIMTARAALRRGASLEEALETARPKAGPQGVMLVPIPLFHVTGCLSWLIRGVVNGMKLVFMRRWDVNDAVEVMKAEGVNVIGG